MDTSIIIGYSKKYKYSRREFGGNILLFFSHTILKTILWKVSEKHGRTA